MPRAFSISMTRSDGMRGHWQTAPRVIPRTRARFAFERAALTAIASPMSIFQRRLGGDLIVHMNPMRIIVNNVHSNSVIDRFASFGQ